MNGVMIQAGSCSINVDTSVYSLEALKKTAYKFADRASIMNQSDSGSWKKVIFNFVGKNADNSQEQIISDFCNELLDQDLREVIRKETGPLRNAIIAHAFSRTPLIEGD